MGIPGIGPRGVEGAHRQGGLKPARGPTASGLFFPLAAAVPSWGTALLAIATVARIAADFAPGTRLALLALAAGCWSAAFLLLLARFAALARPVARGA